jgi:hypothetical protein
MLKGPMTPQYTANRKGSADMRIIHNVDEHPLWHFVPYKPEIVRNFRRWNVAMILVLTLLVVGVLAIAFTPKLPQAAAPPQIAPSAAHPAYHVT